MSFLIDSLEPKRPVPIISEKEIISINRRIEPDEIIYALLEGKYILVKDFYSTGLKIISELKKELGKEYNENHFQGQRNFRQIFRETSQRLLLPIKENKLAVRKAPEIGWLKSLYPDISNFFLSFPDVQGLNSSWQWYEKGIFIPVIKQRLHPFYGTYFPTRFEHLELFSDWLKSYMGQKKSAMDIGTGCGIFSFQLLQFGFKKVFATDINANALIGVNKEKERMNIEEQLILCFGNLLECIDTKTELIVFNPPWLPSSYNPEGIDRAIYYDEDLFPLFFEQANSKLEENGKLIILFSNLAETAGISMIHPVEEELRSGGRFKKEKLIMKKVGKASKKTKRKLTRRENEMVELWVLGKI